MTHCAVRQTGLIALLLLLGSAANLSAQSAPPSHLLVFASPAFEHGCLSTSADLPGSYSFELGVWTNDFVPTAHNRHEWADHWQPLVRTSWRTETGQVIDAVHLPANEAPFTAGRQVYLWGWDSRASGTREWVLLTNPGWALPDAATVGVTVWSTTDSGTVVAANTGTLAGSMGANPYLQSASVDILDENANLPDFPVLTSGAEDSAYAVSVGGFVELSVEPAGAAPFTYQWYFGSPGNTSQPIDGATAPYLTLEAVSPGQIEAWVRVSNALGSVNSGTFTVTVQGLPALFSEAIPLGSGTWHWTEWLGAFALLNNNWVFHPYHDYLYFSPANTPEDIWIYSNELGWTWTTAELYPYLMRWNDQTWLWYDEGSQNPRWFYNTAVEGWESHP